MEIDTQIAVFSMFGGQALGKSFLLNCVLNLVDEGTGVSVSYYRDPYKLF